MYEGTLELTVEISNEKFLEPEKFPELFQSHYNSMMSFMSNIETGFTGNKIR